MDTKTQNLLITQPQPHSNSHSQSHACSQCNCPHHRQGGNSWSRSSSKRRTSHSPGQQSHSPHPGLSPRHPKKTMHSHHATARFSVPGCSYSRNRKSAGGKVKKRKVKRNRQAYKTKRRSSGLHADVYQAYFVGPALSPTCRITQEHTNDSCEERLTNVLPSRPLPRKKKPKVVRKGGGL
ncbi:PREDICTED: nuclear transition protein 2 [Chrysochloris asiatica]|uniref:Nuclear transition protein 2 n=1 Tax=Chrysochloris asiatica TaxID=185453 RepID=A0A9B0TV83_CHRAS|nr:PREDICTED: nuclear transition protein 2 [Chrysochloris asiatica]